MIHRYLVHPVLMLLFLGFLTACTTTPPLRGTGDLGVVIERATGSVQLIQTSPPWHITRITGLGDLSHAAMVYSRDQRYGYVFGRDGGLTKIDLLRQRIDHRIIQGGNSIGGAISQDGQFIAVGNYEPGGVRIFKADTLEPVTDIPTTKLADGTKNARVVGVVDAPGLGFVFSLFDTGEIWTVDLKQPESPTVTRYTGIGKQPYDGMITSDGRHYIAGLFGEDGMALLDLWHPEQGVQRIMDHYGRRGEKLPVYKMPHLEGWTAAGEETFVPGVGEHKVLVLDNRNWTQTGSIDVLGQPVFVVARPDARQVWVNFAYPDNDKVQVIDTENHRITATLTPGPGVLHMEFTPRGEQVWLSVRDNNEIQIWDPYRLKQMARIAAESPSGIFFTSRAHRTGQ